MDGGFKDYYAILGVPKTATEKEIRSAYRKLARQHHPDVNPGDKDAERRFKEINEAHEVLSDPEKRRKYDQLGPNWRSQAAPGRPPGGPGGVQYEYRTVTPEDLEDLFGDREPYSDFFYDLFGGRRARAGPARGEDLAAEVEVSLEEAFHGATRTLELGDSGPSARPRRLEVKIPPGVDTGSRVRLAGQGGPGRAGGPNGDLYLVVTVRPHPRFRREGADLYVRTEAPFTAMALGGEVEVPTLTGRVMLRLPAGTADGRQFRLAGQGMPPVGGGGRGDLYAEVHAAVPSQLSPRERELLEELARLRRPAGAAAGGES
jgi:curved DNA-binding protein